MTVELLEDVRDEVTELLSELIKIGIIRIFR